MASPCGVELLHTFGGSPGLRRRPRRAGAETIHPERLSPAVRRYGPEGFRLFFGQGRGVGEKGGGDFRVRIWAWGLL